jgi:C4-dicarboxylate transporter DctM subunit
MTIILLLTLLGLLVSGVPVFMTLLGSTGAVLLLQHSVDPVIIIQRMIAGLDKFSIMAIPFFMFCADIMSAGQIGARLVKVAKAFFGHLPGGLAIATTAACIVFGAVSGAGAAAVVAIGSLVFTLMKEGKYDEKFSLGLILTTSTLAMLIPPSIAYVLYANITGDSIGTLFMSGLQAGCIFGLVLIVYSYIYAKRKKIPTLPKLSMKERLIALKESVLSLGLIVIILGGIYGGIFTATEAAAVATVYAIIVEVLIYKSLTVKDLFRLAVKSGQTIAMLLILIAAGSVLSWMMTAM